MTAEQKKHRELRRRYIRAQRALYILAGHTPSKASFLARQEADKICKVVRVRNG
jgi:hypothetical protein